VDAGVGTVVVVPMQPRGHVGGTVSGAEVGLAVEPFAQRGLDEALGLAVGAGPVRPRGQVTRAEGGEGSPEEPALGVGESVVGHDRLDPDAEAGEPGGGAGKEAGAGLAALVGQQLGVGQARGIVDRNVQVFPADAARPVAAPVAPRVRLCRPEGGL
jgi:hypothetical protein